jgi:hypothetical protein
MLQIAEKILFEMKCFYRVDEPLKINKKDIEIMEWLIEQAEKVEQLQDKLQRCQESYTYFNRTCDYWRNKAKQYEEELKEIAKYENWLGDDLGDRRLRLVGERAKQVLKGETK